MSYLKLAWIPRTQPGQDVNNSVSEQIKWEVNYFIRRAESLMALEPIHALFNEALRDDDIPTKYSGSDYIAYEVDTGDEAVEILNWWRERGYRSTGFSDDKYNASRDYKMEARDDTTLRFTANVYFGDSTCTFVDKTDEFGAKIVDRVIDSVPAQDAVIVYERELICGDSPMPSGESEG